MMNSLHLGDPVYDFVIENSNNLRLAGQIVKTWPKVRDAIVRQFLGQVERRLRSKLPKSHDWKLVAEGFDVFDQQWPQPIHLTKALWSEHFLEDGESVCFVSLEIQQRGKTAVMGVWRQKAKAGGADLKLVEAFRKLGVSGRANQWWAIQVDLPHEIAGWRDSETLGRLKFETDKWAEEVAESLFIFAKTAEPILDPFFKAQRPKT